MKFKLGFDFLCWIFIYPGFFVMRWQKPDKSKFCAVQTQKASRGGLFALAC